MLGLWWARQFAFIIPPIQSTPATLAISTLTSLTPSNSTPAAITPATPTIPKLTSDIPTTSISANTTLPISNSSSTDKITGKITFSALKDGNQEIYVANTDGSNVHRITVNPSDDAAPAWSPNGKRIAFHSNRGSDHYYHIYVIDIDNHDEPIQSEPIQITEGSSNDQDPTWSPNGESIAFHSNRDNDDNFYNIYVINIAAMDLKPLTKGSHKYLYPTWSEDGNLIAYTSDECHTQCVYVMSSSDGRKLRQLTSEPIYAANPKWSRDGKYIAFQGTLGANSYIYVVDANGNDTPRQITNLISSYWPSWSPNDKQIAFQSNHNAQNEIYVINADGGGEPIKIELGFDEQEYPDWQR
jgi:Tol biopolymer transport system component